MGRLAPHLRNKFILLFRQTSLLRQRRPLRGLLPMHLSFPRIRLQRHLFFDLANFVEYLFAFPTLIFRPLLPQRRPPCLNTLWTIPLIHRQRRINRRKKRLTCLTRTPLRDRNQRIMPHPIRRIVRHLTRQRSIAHPTQRINVRPSPLTTPTRILLYRRIPRRHYRRDRTALRPYGLTCRTKVQQHRRSIHIAQDDVARLDVPMQKVSPMHHLQAIQKRIQYPFEFGFRQRPFPFEMHR